jgi:hypothetical protein
MNKAIMVREPLSFCSSPDQRLKRGIRGTLRRARGTGRLCKGGSAEKGACSGEIGFFA